MSVQARSNVPCDGAGRCQSWMSTAARWPVNPVRPRLAVRLDVVIRTTLLPSSAAVTQGVRDSA